MDLAPYIFFYGKCEEALEFYKGAIGGTYDVVRFDGSPMAEHVPPDFRNKVMHATFNGDGFTFMASDGQPGKTIDPDTGNITLSLAHQDRAAGASIFNALADGGKVLTPMNDVAWGGKFGMVVDRFGNEWMMTTP